jgi:hypothetical protein
MLRQFARFLRRLPPLTISRERAEQIARRECQQRGWEWTPRAKVYEHLRTYFAVSATDTRPGGGWVVIDGYTGKVLSAGRPPC